MLVRLLRGLLMASAAMLLVGLVLSQATIIGVGLGVLIAIPVLNLAGILAGSVRQRDWTTSIAIVVVLAAIGFNVLWVAR